MKTATSVKAQIKYRANKEKRNVQDMCILYVLERVLYRLSISPYKDKFVLKGGCLLYGFDILPGNGNAQILWEIVSWDQLESRMDAILGVKG